MQCVWWGKSEVVVGVDVHVLCICTNIMERTHNFHPALITMMMYNVLIFKQKTALQHYHHESVCVCAWIIYTCIGIC